MAVVLLLIPHNHGSYSLFYMLEAASLREFHQLSSLDLLMSLSASFTTSIYLVIHDPPLVFSFLHSRTTTYSYSAARWFSPSRFPPAIFEFTCSGEGQQSYFLGSVIAARPLASSSSSWCDNTVLIATTSFSALQPALPLGMSLFFIIR